MLTISILEIFRSLDQKTAQKFRLYLLGEVDNEPEGLKPHIFLLS